MYMHLNLPKTTINISSFVDEQSDVELGWEAVVSIGTGFTVLTILIGSTVLPGAGRQIR